MSFLLGLDLPFRRGSLLDYGCGDGELLAALLRSRPTEELESLTVRLEDIAEHSMATGVAKLGNLALQTEAVLISREITYSTRHSIVLAIGVLDYYNDWMIRARELANRSKEQFVFTIPRKRWTTHVLRRCWLAAHGIRIWRASNSDLQKLQDRIGGKWSITRDRSTFYCHVDLASP